MANTPENNLNPGAWTNTQKLALRFFFIYFFIQTVPLDWKYYAQLFSIDWGNLYYGDIFNLSRYYPRFFSGPDTLANWLVTAVLAAAGTVVWTFVEKNRKSPDYDNLYYWLRVILRYRLALAVIAYGFIKVFPLQAPYPSISHLNTNYGDFTAWKIFTLSLGAAPIYEVFLGVVEVLAGLLLLNRKTASIGAFIILSFTGNVFLSNLAYEGGEYIYSLYLTVIAFFIFAYDFNRLASLLSYEKPTEPNRFKPVFTEWKKSTRLALKGAFAFLFVIVYGFKAYSGHKNNPHHIPLTPGLANSSGIYNVKEFVINKDTLPYSTTDLVRWKDVVFENWATISIRSKRPVKLDSTNTEFIARDDYNKTYEVAGSRGRHYYSYEADTVKHILVLTNKNKNHSDEKLVLNYSRPDEKTFVLSGLDENKDSINVTLERIDKKYLLKEGRRKPQKL